MSCWEPSSLNPPHPHWSAPWGQVDSRAAYPAPILPSQGIRRPLTHRPHKALPLPLSPTTEVHCILTELGVYTRACVCVCAMHACTSVCTSTRVAGMALPGAHECTRVKISVSAYAMCKHTYLHACAHTRIYLRACCVSSVYTPRPTTCSLLRIDLSNQ